MEQLGTVKDGSAYTRVTVKAFYGMVADGTIPRACVVRLGHRLRIDMQRLREFVDGGGTKPHEEAPRQVDPEGEHVAAGPRG
jgi:hypothetical protein